MAIRVLGFHRRRGRVDRLGVGRRDLRTLQRRNFVLRQVVCLIENRQVNPIKTTALVAGSNTELHRDFSAEFRADDDFTEALFSASH
ncbi:Uncharacterised protein [Mycobacteroides abscessus subsp. abscessus]|nr:Uncharacterised protein [Mycobacteroides abscessus subsp. abscessus]